jgi:hypothetical protein
MTQVIEKSAANLVCVKLEVHIWGGRRHLEKADLIHANPEFKKLPSEKLATLGAYKICNPSEIRRFNSTKGRAERVLKRHGLPILGVWGVPSDKYQVVHEELVAIQDEFEVLKGAFVTGYDKAVEAWKLEQLIENPEYAHLFNDTPTATHVSNRLSFEFHPCRISAPADMQAPELNERFERQVTGLKGELMQEVATEANTLITEYLTTRSAGGVLKQREYVTPKTLGPLKRAVAKLNSFRFLDGTIGPLADAINDVVKALPTERIEGASLIKVWSLARMLSSPSIAVEMAVLASEGASADDLIARNGITTLATVPVAVQSGAPAQIEPAMLGAPAKLAAMKPAASELSMLL